MGLTAWFVCTFGHGHRVRVRDEEGRMILKCSDCGEGEPVLQSETLKGPAHQPDPVKGQPNLKAVKSSWFDKRRSA